MRELDWLALWVFLLPLLGAPLLSHRVYRSLPIACRLVLSGAVGAVILSFTQTVSALAGLPWRALPLALLTAAIAGSLRAVAGGSAPPSPMALEDPGKSLAGFLAAGSIGIALLLTAGGAAGSSDLLLFWGPKAQAFASARTIDAGFLSDPRNAHMHPYYPPLATNLFALSTMIAGGLPWGAATFTFPLLLVGLAVTLPSLLRRAERPWAPAAISAVVVSALALLGTEADVAGNADVFLWLFELVGIALLLAPRPIDAPRLLLAGLLLAGAATSKVEGLPFVLAAALFFLAGRRARSGVSLSGALLLAPTALSLGAWFWLGLSRKVFDRYGEYGSLLDLRWERFGLVVSQVARAFWSTGGALPFLVPLAVLLLGPGGARRLPLAAAATLAAFLTVTYLSPVPDPRLWIEWSASRTFAPIAALLALSAAAPNERGRAKYAMASNSDTPEIQSPAAKDSGQ
jgi:hypothetical protein